RYTSGICRRPRPGFSRIADAGRKSNALVHGLSRRCSWRSPVRTEGARPMSLSAALALEPAPSAEPFSLRAPQTWAVVLAGGDGVRLRPLVRQLLGHARPKQYVPCRVPDSPLRQTLNRVRRVVPPERTVVVTRAEHAPYVARELPDGSAPHVLLQPEDRGTGTAVLFAAHRIRDWDPDA